MFTPGQLKSTVATDSESPNQQAPSQSSDQPATIAAACAHSFANTSQTSSPQTSASLGSRSECGEIVGQSSATTVLQPRVLAPPLALRMDAPAATLCDRDSAQQAADADAESGSDWSASAPSPHPRAADASGSAQAEGPNASLRGERIRTSASDTSACGGKAQLHARGATALANMAALRVRHESSSSESDDDSNSGDDSTKAQRSPDVHLAGLRGVPRGFTGQSFDPMRASNYGALGEQSNSAGPAHGRKPALRFAARPVLTPPFQHPERSETLLTSSAGPAATVSAGGSPRERSLRSSCSSNARVPGAADYAVSAHIELPDETSLTSAESMPSPLPRLRDWAQSPADATSGPGIGALACGPVPPGTNVCPSRGAAVWPPGLLHARDNPLSKEGLEIDGGDKGGRGGGGMVMHAMLDRYSDMAAHLNMWRGLAVDDKGKAEAVPAGCATKGT